MSSRPSDLATDTRWCPSRTKNRSPIWKSEIGGSASPRRWAAAIRSQRERRRAEVGRKPRSKSTARSTVPTIASSGTIWSPRSPGPVRPSASTTSSNGRMSPTSSGSRRNLRATSDSSRARRARLKSCWASEAENPELTADRGYLSCADRIAVERLVERADDREDAVQARDPERLRDRVTCADDDQRSALAAESAVRPDQDAERRGVDEGGRGQVHDHVQPAGIDRCRDALLELGCGEEVDLARDRDDMGVVADRAIVDFEVDGHARGVIPPQRDSQSHGVR